MSVASTRDQHDQRRKRDPNGYPVAFTETEGDEALLRTLAELLQCTPAEAAHVALLELGGRVHRLREYGDVRLSRYNPMATSAERRGDIAYVEFLADAFRKWKRGEAAMCPPPPALAPHAISGRHRIHGARAAGMTSMLCYRIDKPENRDPRQLKPIPRPGEDPVYNRMQLEKKRPGITKRLTLAARRNELARQLRAVERELGLRVT
jgi:hypothetical protein